ncbi:hypothetical protein, variant [Sphaeroforma arctica JP610]|uniref:Phytanoyl-CoA dioxygenase n=1 Tax=Sphaeroforma arctica JP610 TaxID=667725 RepID=A0A0L0GD15_9EUKA|nr:hypothetical protein, variant [Sphaeroforma arctica JP610]KNC86781.1 hypothetical protein, variant [Sphaeroforma arctica JP610]|eukprot:XP_014160683.1 hypothetical protein, variant [Sphaeroforma arctica JP610]
MTDSASANPFDRSHFASEGYAVAGQFLSAAQIADFREVSKKCAPNLDLKAQYHQPDDVHRYEYMLFNSGFAETFKPLIDHLLVGPLPQLQKLFGRRIKNTVAKGLRAGDAFCIVSEQGSKDQVWHTDSVPVPGHFEVADWCSSLHYVGFLVPLVHTTHKVGRTEIQPRSHLGPQHTLPAVALSMEMGDVLVLDGRTHHRGLGNTSAETDVATLTAKEADQRARRICFFTFKLPSLIDANAASYSVDLTTANTEAIHKRSKQVQKHKDKNGKRTHKKPSMPVQLTGLTKTHKAIVVKKPKKKGWAVNKVE